MLLTNISSGVIALLSLIGTSSAQGGMPARVPLLQKYPHTTCKYATGGHIRRYDLNKCYDFYETDHGLQLWALPDGCTLRTYKNRGCTGPTSKYGTDRSAQKDCVSLQDRWSMKTTCN